MIIGQELLRATHPVGKNKVEDRCVQKRPNNFVCEFLMVHWRLLINVKERVPFNHIENEKSKSSDREQYRHSEAKHHGDKTVIQNK